MRGAVTCGTVDTCQALGALAIIASGLGFTLKNSSFSPTARPFKLNRSRRRCFNLIEIRSWRRVLFECGSYRMSVRRRRYSSAPSHLKIATQVASSQAVASSDHSEQDTLPVLRV